MPDNISKSVSPQIVVAPIFLISNKEIKPEVAVAISEEGKTYSQAIYTQLNLKSGSLAQSNEFKPTEIANALQELAKVLEQLTVNSIGLTYFKDGGSEFSFVIDINQVLVGLSILKSKNETSFRLSLDNLKLESKVLENGFVGTFESRTTIALGKIFGQGIDNLPDSVKELKITPKAGLFVYQKGTSKPENSKAGDAPTSTKKFIFGMDLGIEFPALTELPLIGDKLPADKTLSIDNIRFLIVSADFNQADLDDILSQAQTPSVIDTFLGKAQTLSKGGNLSTAIRFGEDIYPLDLAMAGTTSKREPPPSTRHPQSSPAKIGTKPSEAHSSPPKTSSTEANSSKPSSPQPVTPPDIGPTLWINVQKKVGPVSFNRVGVRYYDKLLWLLLDMALSMSDLTLSLNGLAAGFDIIAAFKNPKALLKPRFRLDGIGLEYTGKGPLQIGGAFLREDITLDNGQTVEQYSGAALIKTDAFSLSAIGAYTELNGSPSLFIYAFLNRPLGGPAFFFVTGLALGFGYNRDLRTPTAVEDVASFPLVRLALNAAPPIPKKKGPPKNSSTTADSASELQPSGQEKGELLEVLGQLQSYIPPASGKVFLAVGVKFTSFKLIDSFALLIATFGDDFRLKLLGISKIVAPPADSGKTPIAEVSIGLIAEFIPKEGVLKVDGKILPGAYIFSRDCQISGGFAFYSWFSGPHAGDFVLTVGGYHPRFQVPAHYPRVDRFSLNWQVDSSLSIKGSAYFALTSSAVMAGGSLEARLDKGRLQAWFNFNANFLVAWQPFHYDADISVEIGVSYRTFIKTFHFSVGVYLHIWGPEFQGTAEINAKVVKFKVAFGQTGGSKPEPLTWPQFKAAFLPSDAEICTLSVQDGLTRTLKYEDNTERWIVNPKELALQVDTIIPCTHQGLPVDFRRREPSSTLGIGSMKVSQLQSNLTIQVSKKESDQYKKCEAEFDYTPVYKSVPSALWGTKLQPDLNDRPITNALCGFELRPAKHPSPGDTNDVRCSNLAYNPDDFSQSYSWQPLTNPLVIHDTSTTIEEVKTALQKQTQTKRKDLEKLIGLDQIDLNDPLDDVLEDKLIDDFLETPQLVTV